MGGTLHRVSFILGMRHFTGNYTTAARARRSYETIGLAYQCRPTSMLAIFVRFLSDVCMGFFDKMFNDLHFVCHCSVFVFLEFSYAHGFFKSGNLLSYLSGRSTVHWPITCIIHASLMHESVYETTRWSVTIAPRLFTTFPVKCLVPSYAIPGEMSHNRHFNFGNKLIRNYAWNSKGFLYNFVFTLNMQIAEV